MIQRIQSLYLLVVAVVAAMLLLADIDFYKETGKVRQETELITVSVNYVQAHVNQEVIEKTSILSYLIAAIGFIALAAIFLFKNRKLQLRFALIIMSLCVAVGIFMYRYSYGIGYTEFETKTELLMGAYFPLTLLIFAAMAYRGIQKDEKLVKSLDRIR
ncbi:MAG: DUF4293 domain-containing protein [Flavobacteriales bacterium]|nr:DUF4293 domain-containing protein [Flavobacteriales bacterium]